MQLLVQASTEAFVTEGIETIIFTLSGDGLLLCRPSLGLFLDIVQPLQAFRDSRVVSCTRVRRQQRENQGEEPVHVTDRVGHNSDAQRIGFYPSCEGMADKIC
jgi:hypothetical protein